jgi:hypothetical protein
MRLLECKTHAAVRNQPLTDWPLMGRGPWGLGARRHTIQLKTAGTSSCMFMYTPAPLASAAHAHGGHENPETLVTYLETVQGHAAW